MEIFLWSSRSSLSFAFIFTFICLVFMIHNSEAQPKTDPEEANALNTIFAKWGISAHSTWNISGEPCSGTAIEKNVSIDDQRYNPFVTCDCSYDAGTVCRIANMKVFDNNVRGVIPVELQKLKELRNLNLMKNYLTGPLPAFIGNLTKMEFLTFAFNALSGTIPKEFGNLQNIISLSFAVNNFSGSLPSELGNLKTLQKLYVDSAGLSGEIPSTFANLEDMRTFFASDNNFTGKLPDFIGNWMKLEDLRIRGNAFQGPIPASFSRLSSLRMLQLSELSNASSSLEFISNITSLDTLILRNCEITGSLSSIENLKSLQHLDLSFNNISGSIPQSLFSLSSLVSLFLGNNNLSRVLPPTKATQLNVIDLSYNFLSGKLPPWATNNSDLQLNLVANNFTKNDLNSSKNYTLLHCIQRDFPCNGDSPKYSSFAINSGGPTIITEKIEFEKDAKELGAASFYVTNSTRWAVSSVGTFLYSTSEMYIQKSNSENCFIINKDISFPSQRLLKDVRVSPGSIRYYGLGLRNGNYTVNLQFVELDSASERTWQSLQRRVFDIYIQRVLKEKDFDIRKEATTLLLSLNKGYENIQVTENFLEIHLFWAGKGTCCIPRRNTYGPSIAALSVVLENSPNRRNFGVIIGISISIGLIILLSIMIILILRRRMSLNNDEELRGITFRTQTFSYAELKTATNGFDQKNKLGEGGFGPVYKGMLSDGRAVAVKQLSLRSHQGKIQFVTEIDTISAVQHRNLVKLYGCCIEGINRMLVYEYLENKSLDQALFGKSDLDLSWKSRFEICVGTGRGLAYLHEESRPKIVHRDVKASNILLDVELKPKISDFGLAKLYDDNNTHISTRVAGTIGYLAPEYAMKGHLSEKADVFGYGVAILEILSGRQNFASNLSSEQVYLLEWAWLLHENNRQLELVDPRLKDFNKEEAIRVFTVGLLCTQLSPTLRPSMSRVVSMLLGDAELSVISSKPGYLNDFDVADSEGSSNILPSMTSTSLSINNLQTRWYSGSTSEEPSISQNS